jgi:hypothetical protein
MPSDVAFVFIEVKVGEVHGLKHRDQDEAGNRRFQQSFQ